MHVYVCVRVCTCVHEHLLETHGDALARVCVYMHVCMCTCVYRCVHVYMSASTSWRPTGMPLRRL